MTKSKIGLVLGVLVCLLLYFIPIEGLSLQGQTALALTMMTVIFWACQVAHPGFISGIYLALLVILQVAPASIVFSPWIGSTMYFVIGAYLIAAAVKNSGLGERIAMIVIARYISNFRSIIISIFALNALLSLLIPNSWARSFIIMAVMKQVIENANLNKRDAITIGFAVFASSIPTSMIFLTGESAINLVLLQYVDTPINWLRWFFYMGPPAIAATFITMVTILLVFRPKEAVSVDKEIVKERLSQMGKLTNKEWRVIIWMTIAIVVWMTDGLHGIDIGFATLAITMLMGFPVIGKIVGAEDWADVPIHVLIFLTAAIAIGRVGDASGMNDFIAGLMFPSFVPQNIFVMAALVSAIAILIHMVLGSVIAVLSVVIPAVLIFTAPLGLNPLIPIFIVYVAVFGHFILPFHSISILVGVGEKNGLYSEKECIRAGIPLTLMVFIVVLAIQLPWWRLIGLY